MLPAQEGPPGEKVQPSCSAGLQPSFPHTPQDLAPRGRGSRPTSSGLREAAAIGRNPVLSQMHEALGQGEKGYTLPSC